MGTALIEQLLRSCNVRKVYLLMRSKRSLSTEERLAKVKEEMVSSLQGSLKNFIEIR